LFTCVQGPLPTSQTFSPFITEKRTAPWNVWDLNIEATHSQSPDRTFPAQEILLRCPCQLSATKTTMASQHHRDFFHINQPLTEPSQWLPNINHRPSPMGLHEPPLSAVQRAPHPLRLSDNQLQILHQQRWPQQQQQQQHHPDSNAALPQ
jgi:hypothetical protein